MGTVSIIDGEKGRKRNLLFQEGREGESHMFTQSPREKLGVGGKKGGRGGSHSITRKKREKKTKLGSTWV